MQQEASITLNFNELATDIKRWGRELGFQQVGITDTDLGEHPEYLANWLDKGFQANMEWLREPKRVDPEALIPGTKRIISLRMDYLPAEPRIHEILNDGNRAYLARYALGRDYHKIIRKRLQHLADRIVAAVGPFGYRAFVDSAPVLEAELAARSGQGWRGKHTLLLSREAGSMFFLGEIYVDLALPPSAAVTEHCGSCSACIDVCPTQAIVAPHRLDARRCISYLTIELKGAIPVELRPLIGNRVYGCDDCQLCCPWNKFAKRSALPDFDERHGLGAAQLVHLMQWDETTFLRLTEGSAIRRIGHVRWLRNLAIAIGNALRAVPALPLAEQESLRQAAQVWAEHTDPVVRESVAWALAA